MTGIKPIAIVCGHYGCGKTNFTLNLALALRAEGERVCVIDLDIVNPYFRSSDYNELLEHRGIELIAPNMARTTLDTPSLPASVDAAFETPRGYVLVDAGGDDAGATALGRYAAEIRAQAYEMLYVINQNRAMVAEPAGALEILREIEAASHLKATGLVNNTHLAEQTNAQTVQHGAAYAQAVSDFCGLPVTFTCVPTALRDACGDLPGAFPVEVLVQKPWEQNSL